MNRQGQDRGASKRQGVDDATFRNDRKGGGLNQLLLGKNGRLDPKDMFRIMLLQQLFGGGESEGNSGTVYEDDVNYYGEPGTYVGDESSMNLPGMSLGTPQAAPASAYSDPAMTSQLDLPWPETQGQYPAAGGVPDLVTANTAQASPAPAADGPMAIPTAYQTFRQAGFDDQRARLMTAIAMGESGLNPQAHNPNAATGDNSYGLTQINMLGNLQGPRLKEFGIESNEQLFDPLTNAKAAYSVSGGGQNFSPWSVYKKGAHQQYIDDVERALAGLSDQLPAESPPTTPEEEEE